MSVEMFTKSLVKTLVISRCLAKLWPLSKKLDGAIIDTPFKEISFFITFHVLFESFKLFGTNLSDRIFYFPGTVKPVHNDHLGDEVSEVVLERSPL